MQFEPFAFFTSVNNYLTAADGSSLQLVAPNEIVAGFFLPWLSTERLVSIFVWFIPVLGSS